jgi:hypothetical protein
MEPIIQEVSEPQRAILKSVKPMNLFLSGIGAGKTFLAGAITYRFIRYFPQCFGFIATNFYEQLNLSTLYRVREYWKSLGLTEWSKDNPGGMYVAGKQPPAHFSRAHHNFDSYNSIISFINGAVIFMGSLENSLAHEGKTFSWAILDETKDSRESDVKEIIIGRLRQKGVYVKDGQFATEGEDINPLYILTSPSKSDWINNWFQLDSYVNEISDKIYSETDFFQKEIGNKFVVISSTYHNRKNLTSGYIQNILDSNTAERGKALIYACPFATLGGEFYSSFDRLKHVGKCQYDKTKPLHISFDQNSVPYNSCSLWQFERKDDIWWSYCIDEIALENPRNSTEEVCEDILMRYAGHKSAIYYYGDASGKARSTMNKEFKHHYEIIEYKLRRFLTNGSARMMRQNPSITKRRDFINRIFEDKLPIRILIDESCKLMVADMMYVKQDINGAKDKHIVTDKETGDRYQKYGHLGDNLEYILVEVYNNYYK